MSEPTPTPAPEPGATKADDPKPDGTTLAAGSQAAGSQAAGDAKPDGTTKAGDAPVEGATKADGPAAPATPAPAEAKKDAPLEDPVEAMRARGRHPEVAAVLGWLVPGLGHLYAGYPLKGIAALLLLGGMFVAGLLVSGGECVSLDPVRGHRYAFIAQVGAGLPTAGGLAWTKKREADDREAGRPTPLVTDEAYIRRLPDTDVGLLFTMVAGLLNLLLIQDLLSGVPGALARRAEEARLARRLAALRAELEAEQAKAGAAPAAPPPAGGAA